MMVLMGLISLTYDSSAVELFSEVELVSLLKQSREKNTRLGLTGMLLHKNGEFMQVLEGEQRSVEKLYSMIEKDLRHRNCSIVRWEAIKERRFPAWSMGFKNLQNLDLRQVPGYSPFMDEPLTSPSFLADPSRAHKLLQMFREKE
jgi:hypothetical protein